MAPEAEGYWEKVARDHERQLLAIAAMVGNPPLEYLVDILRGQLAAAAEQPALTDFAALQAALDCEGD